MLREINYTVAMNFDPAMAVQNTESVSNFSLLIGSDFMDIEAESDPEYEQFLADVWVGIVLTLMVLSCVCCMCSCLLYHKFQQWKRSVIEARQASEIESGYHEADTLPSYTIASGLPSYAEALEQLKKVKELTKGTKSSEPNTSPVVASTIHRLSITELFQIYRTNGNSSSFTLDSKS